MNKIEIGDTVQVNWGGRKTFVVERLCDCGCLGCYGPDGGVYTRTEVDIIQKHNCKINLKEIDWV